MHGHKFNLELKQEIRHYNRPLWKANLVFVTVKPLNMKPTIYYVPQAILL